MTFDTVSTMKLSDYLQTLSDEEKNAFAKLAGINRQYLWAISRGWRAAGGRAMVAIERASDGAVTAEELRPDLFGGRLRLRKVGGGYIERRGRAA